MKLTQHFIERRAERVLEKPDIKEVLKFGMGSGKRKKQQKVNKTIKKYLISLKDRRGGYPIIYKGFVYIICKDTLVTVFPVAEEMREKVKEIEGLRGII